MAPTSKQKARARLTQARSAAIAERAARERLDLNDLAEAVYQVELADSVHDVWLGAQIAKLRIEADNRRRRHLATAGRSLAALRARGESVAAIAGQTGIAQSKIREYLELAATDEQTEVAEGATDEQKSSEDESPVLAEDGPVPTEKEQPGIAENDPPVPTEKSRSGVAAVAIDGSSA